MTICVKCKFHKSTHFGSRAGPLSTTWYYNRCTHPSVEKVEIIDPVTGEKCFSQLNSLGKEQYTDERHSYCKEINKGYCGLYEPK
jgi:hypothetical protein